MFKKLQVAVLVLLVSNTVFSTVWFNFFDPQMLYLEQAFKKEDYGYIKAREIKEVTNDGVETEFSGGIFFLRDEHLKEAGVHHRCRWVAHEYTMEPRQTNTLCLFFWFPVTA